VQSASGRVTMQSLRDNVFLAGSYTRKNFFLMRRVSTYNADIAGLTEEQAEASSCTACYCVSDSIYF
jgi:hypothetical protein